jgi:hypothetical protein
MSQWDWFRAGEAMHPNMQSRWASGLGSYGRVPMPKPWVPPRWGDQWDGFMVGQGMHPEMQSRWASGLGSRGRLPAPRQWPGFMRGDPRSPAMDSRWAATFRVNGTGYPPGFPRGR